MLPLQVVTGVVVYVALSFIFKLDSFNYILSTGKRLLNRKSA